MLFSGLGAGIGYSNGLGDLLNQQHQLSMLAQQADCLNYPQGLQNQAAMQVNPDDRLLVLLTEVE